MAFVLIVDDDAPTCRLMERIVRTFGHDAECLTSPAAALGRLTAVPPPPPDLAILDVMMPGMDGVELLRRVRATPAGAAVPVIMFSAVADDRTRRAAMAAGAALWWVKAGVSVETMGRDIARVLGQDRQ
jgi:CheY-like chemotaxis protein